MTLASRHLRGLLLPLFLVLLSSWSCQSALQPKPFQSLSKTKTSLPWGLTVSSLKHHSSIIHQFPILVSLRGGADDSDSDDESESDQQDEEDEEDDEYDDTDDDDDDVEETDDDDEAESDDEEGKPTVIAKKDTNYVDPLFPSPMMSLYSTVGIMLLSRKVDLFHPTVVKVARFAFLAYIVILQLVLVYIRIQAKLANDRTPIQMSNPLSGLLAQQQGMVKSLASSFLASSSTILEYDLQQARNMQSGILFNLAFMWFLHFKMGQVQPLLMTTMNGFINLYYSPLFQVYVMNRNLERPFKTQQAIMQTEQEAATTENGGEASSSSTDTDVAATSLVQPKVVQKATPKKKVTKEEEEVDDEEEDETDDESDSYESDDDEEEQDD